MKRILSLLLVLGLSLGMLTGCSNSNKSADENNDTVAGGSAEEESKEIALTDSKGEIKLDGVAKKIVVFDMGIIDTISVLAPDLELAAPVDNIPSNVTNLTNVVSAGAIKEPDMEAIYNFEPDLIVISGRQEDYYEELSKIAPTLYVKLDSTTYIDDFKTNNRNIAKAIGKEKEVEVYFNEIDDQIDTLLATTMFTEDKALIVLANDGNLSAYGKGSRFGIIHDFLGVKTSDDDIKVSTHGQEASFEYIAKVNPDILFVVDRTVIAGGSVAASDILNNDLVNNTNAGKNGKIVYLDSEAWYVSCGGLNTIKIMLNDVEKAFK